MNKEELRTTIEKRKEDCRKELRFLYGIFNKTELSVAGKKEQEIGEETAQAKEYLQVLKDRQYAIGGAGHNKFCPCCGLELPHGYFKELCEAVREQEKKVKILEDECVRMATERESKQTNALTEEISKKENELKEIEDLEREAIDAGLI